MRDWKTQPPTRYVLEHVESSPMATAMPDVSADDLARAADHEAGTERLLTPALPRRRLMFGPCQQESES